MKIGINGQDFNPGNTGGSETYFRDLIDGLPAVDRDDEYFVYLPAKFSNSISTRQNNLIYRSLDSKFKVINKLKNKLKVNKNPYLNSKLNLVHFAFQRTDVGKLDFPILVTFHDIQDSYLPDNFSVDELTQRKEINQRAISESDHIIAISEFTKNTLIEKYRVSEDKITFIHHGIDDVYFKLKNNVESDNKYFFYPAATWPHKNHMRLLKAFKNVSQLHPEYKLILSGANKQESKRIEEYILDNNLDSNVKHLGYVDYDELPKLYENAFALVFPSLFEGFGYPVIEAMAGGCPVLCSNTTSLPEVAGEAALYFNPESEKDIFEKMVEIIGNHSKRSELVKRGPKQAKKFTKDQMIKNTLALYKRVIENYKHEK